MSGEGLYKAEAIYIRDSGKGGVGDLDQQEASTLLNFPADHPTPAQTLAPVNVLAENTVHHFVSRPATMDTTVNKHPSISQQHCHNTQLSSGLIFNRVSESDERQSPANSADLFATPDSSRSQSQESVLSWSWDKDRSCSALRASPPTSPPTSPVSFSRALSSCSSVRSGVFTPSLVRVRRQTLQPASSLVHMPPTCFSPSCASPPSSPCPLSPSSRHRLAPTRLSLLTAILRKGRLPVLSPSLSSQRPYSPCWPVHRGTSCNACSAASNVAPIPLEGSRLRARPSATVPVALTEDGGTSKPLRGVTAPQSVESVELPTSWRKIGPHSPPLLRLGERKSHSGLMSERAASHSYQRLLSSPIPPQPFTHYTLRPVDYARVPLPKVLSPPIYTSQSRLRYMSPDPLNSSVNSRPGSLSPEPKQVKNQGTSVPQDSNHPQKSSSSRHQNKSPESVTTSNSTLDTTSLKPKLINKTFVQALNSHLHSKLSSLSSADNKAQVASRPDVPSTGMSNNWGTSMGTLNHRVPQVSSPLPCSSPSRLDVMDVNTRPRSEGRLPGPSQLLSVPASSTQRHRDVPSPTRSQNGMKAPPGSVQRLSVPQGHRSFCLTPSRYTAPGCTSPGPDTPPSTPDRFNLSPSPATLARDLAPSPSLSLRSTPSPCLWREMSDSIDKRRKPHKIKLSYKTFAAIPTNNLLLDQQAIDDEVDEVSDSQDTVDGCMKGGTHEEMCSPAQLRQQSEELYTVIDKVLEDPVSVRHTAPTHAYSRETLDKGGSKMQRYTLLPKSLGRETKYAFFNQQPSAAVEIKLTDPYKLEKSALRETTAGGNITSGRLALHTERSGGNNSSAEEDHYSMSITESEEPKTNPANDGSGHGVAASFNPVKRQRQSGSVSRMANYEEPANVFSVEKIKIFLICNPLVE